MEVDGRLADSTAVVEWCQPCADAGNDVIAVKFCSVCKDWLCSACTDFHRRFKASKHHTLYDEDALPVTVQDIEQENKTKYCKTHPNELIKYFCPTHKLFTVGIVPHQVHAKWIKYQTFARTSEMMKSSRN